MPNIRNLKDPTGAWSSKQRNILNLISLIICLLHATLVTYVESYEYGINTQQNVTCIAHDTKFTCDCRNINTPLYLPKMEGFVYQIEIQNCKSLIVNANTLDETQGLRKITLRNIDNLVLNKYSLVYPRHSSNSPLIFEFNQVNFELIDSHAINGNIEEIYFIDCRIRLINPFGFTTFKERATLLRMHNVIVERIEQQAFKKFAVEQMEITSCKFESMPSKAFYELEILAVLRIDNCRFKDVHTRALSFKKATKLTITNNHFLTAEAEWIDIFVKENVMIQNNNFGIANEISFKAIAVHREYILSEPLELRFLNNTVSLQPDIRPLQFNERFTLIISQLRFDNEYACKDLDLEQKPPKPRDHFFRLNSDNIYMRRNQPVNDKNSKDNSNQSFESLSRIIALDCQQPSYVAYIVSGVAVLIVILALIAGIVYWQISKRRKRHKLNMIMPEPRTYKETQIVYQIENAGLLKTDL